MTFPRWQYGVQCSQCREVIFSNSRHDFVTCKCNATYIDGGFDYTRVGGEPTLRLGVPIRRRRRLAERPPFYFRDES